MNDDDGKAEVSAPAFAMVIIAALLAGAGVMMSCSVYRFAPRDRGAPGHHGEKLFRNIYPTEGRGFGDVLRWKFGGGPKEEPPIPRDLIPGYRPERAAPDLERIAHPDPGTIQVTWIGVKAHQDLGAEDSVAMHWGTINQADEPMAEPPIFLRTALKASGLSEDCVHIMRFGQTLVFRRR